MYFATGNNLMFTGDMVRRALRCTIDAGCERPEERTFKTVRPDLAMAGNRVEIVMAGLTILRAFFRAGCPKQSEPAGNFERWSATIRDCLIWLGEADPWLSTVGVRKEDPEIENNIAALTAWHDTFETRQMTTKDVIEAANARAEPAQGAPGRLVNATLRDALQVVAGGRLDSQNLGTWLRGIKSRPIGGYVVAQAGMSAGNNRWQVTVVGEPQTNDTHHEKSIVEANV